MKKIILLLAVAATTVFTSCTEETIVQETVEENFFLAQTFETTTTLNFNSSTDLYESEFITYPFEVFESDAVLAYRLEEVVNGTDVWTQLPHNFFLGNGDIIQYVFTHTFIDVQVLIDGSYNPNTLSTDFTDNQTFRFVVVPSEFADANLTMDQAIEQFNLQF